MELTAAFCFSGGGGCTQGAVAAGYKPIWAIESDPYAAAVYRKRFPECDLIEEDIHKLSDEFISNLPSPSLYIFGSPCPDFSMAGKRAGITGNRGSLFFEGLRPLQLSKKPIPCFIFENVGGLLSSSSDTKTLWANRIIQRYRQGNWGISKETYEIAITIKELYKGSDFAQILHAFGKLGYDSSFQIRNGNRWVPQNRERVFCIGVNSKYTMPED